MISRWMQEYGSEVSAEKIKPESILPAAGDAEELLARCKLFYKNFTRVLK
jgi:hypothetical protein